MLMWLLLPPIFFFCVGLALASPLFVRKPKERDVGERDAVPKHALADRTQ
jgi:hypothetical protein